MPSFLNLATQKRILVGAADVDEEDLGFGAVRFLARAARGGRAPQLAQLDQVLGRDARRFLRLQLLHRDRLDRLKTQENVNQTFQPSIVPTETSVAG